LGPVVLEHIRHAAKEVEQMVIIKYYLLFDMIHHTLPLIKINLPIVVLVSFVNEV
jgi:hypothetical protein